MKSWKGSYLYAGLGFAVWLQIYGEDDATVQVKAGIPWDTRSLFDKWHCSFCDKWYELKEGFLPHVDGRTHKPVCGECIESLIFETWSRGGVHGK